MGVKGKVFEGRSYVGPGARGKFRAPSVSQGVSQDEFTQVIIGKANNGVNCNDATLTDDERYMLFTNFEDAKKVLGGGELLEAIYLADSPSSEDDFAGGPQLFKILNICPNTKAYSDFLSLETGETHRISYPIPGPNGKKVRVKKNSASKTIEIGDASGSQTSPKLERKVFDITYTGDGAVAKITIDATKINVTLSGTPPTDGSTSLDVLYADYPTIGEAVDFINSKTGYVANLIDAPEFACGKLDHIKAADNISVKTTAATIYADLYEEEIFLLNSGLAEISVGATRKALAGTTSPIFLTQGGVTGTPSGTAVKDAITFSKKVSGLYRNLLTSTLSDKVAWKTAGYDMISPDGQKETICGCGGDLVQTVDERRSEARTMGVYWMNYGIEKFEFFGLDGNKKTYPGFMLSVIDNAISASNSPRHSPTWKQLNILRSMENLHGLIGDQCIRDGGLVIRQDPSNLAWIIERSVTTELKDNIVLNEKSSVAVALTMVRRLREGFNSRFTGRAPVDDQALVQGVRVSDVIGYVERSLQTFVEEGFLMGSAELGIKAFKEEIGIRIDGDTWSFTDLQGNVVLPINFIFYILSLYPLQGKA